MTASRADAPPAEALLDALGDAWVSADRDLVVTSRRGALLREEVPEGASLGVLLGEGVRSAAQSLAKVGSSTACLVDVRERRVAVHLVRSEAGFVAWLRDLTEERALLEEADAERTLRARSEAFYEALVGCIDDAVLVHDFDSGLVLEGNPAAEELLGYSLEELRGLRGRDLHPEAERDKVRDISARLRQRGAAYVARVEVRRKGGGRFWGALRLNVFEHAGRRYIVVILRDVTEPVEEVETLTQSLLDLEQAQAQLAQAQKLAAVGEVAAGVAHEINNPTAVMAMNQSYLDEAMETIQRLMGTLDDLADEEPRLRRLLSEHPVDLEGVRSVLRDNVEGTRRIASVCRNLRLFSRPDSARGEEPVDLEEVIRATINLLRNEVRHRARLTVDLAVTPPVRGDRFRLTQVVTNLLLNAIQAIDEGATEDNSIDVTTRRIGETIQLEVRDTGRGMSPDTVERIFEPFFTTRLSDQGTGLGLALCADVVQQYGGRIEVESELGAGTTFRVVLPLAVDASSGTVVRQSTAPPPSGAASRRARVLVVDDDLAVVRAYRRLLRGYDATVVTSGFEALELFQADARFDLVICDLMMPGMDGPQLYRHITEQYPSLVDRVVFCTGGAFTPRARAFAAATQAPVLDKPLQRRDVDRLLQRPSRSTVPPASDQRLAPLTRSSAAPDDD